MTPERVSPSRTALLVIAKRASNVKAADYKQYIFGYTCFIDGSARGLPPSGNTTYGPSQVTYALTAGVLTQTVQQATTTTMRLPTRRPMASAWWMWPPRNSPANSQPARILKSSP